MGKNGKLTQTEPEAPLVALRVAAEKHLVRPGGGTRHLDFHLTVGPGVERQREPVSIALAILDRLESRDTASITVFDTEIDTILPAVSVTRESRDRARRALDGVDARSTTALHQGWLMGCRSIASDFPVPDHGRLARCFLLTDGLANVGERDPEKIAEEAAGIRKNAGIGTSTFGIGPDYDEGLLGPMAVAARGVRLEVLLEGRATPDLISEYWLSPDRSSGRMLIDVGDLMAGEERHLVLRLRLEPVPPAGRVAVRARPSWQTKEGPAEGGWEEIAFTAASDAECNAEERSRTVLHWVGVHHAARTKKLAMDATRGGDEHEAIRLLETAARRLARYAHGDPELERALEELRQLREKLQRGTFSRAMAMEARYTSQLSSRGQRDHRQPQ